jgi:hypothetical protein
VSTILETGYPELADQLIRHIQDIKERSHEGTSSERADKEAAFRVGFDLATPTALACLEQINELLLDGTGTASTRGVESDGDGGLIGTWELTWPLMEGTIDRCTGKPLPPARIGVVFPTTFFHPHLSVLRPEPLDPPRGVIPEAGPDAIFAWPFQVTSAADGEQLAPLFWAIALGEVHERTARAEIAWNVIPEHPKPQAWGRAKGITG